MKKRSRAKLFGLTLAAALTLTILTACGGGTAALPPGTGAQSAAPTPDSDGVVLPPEAVS